jgi:parallel beta-helix repeat protein
MMSKGKMISIMLIGVMLFSLIVFYPEVVKAQEVDYIIIANYRYDTGGNGDWVGPRNYPLGNNDTFYAAGYNISSGFIGFVNVNWTSTDSGVGTVTTPGYSTFFNAIGLGTCIVTANYGGGITNSTGILRVATVDEIKIRDSPDGGGEEVMDESYYLGNQSGNHGYWAASYNDTYGYLDDVWVTWTSSDTTVIEVIVYPYEYNYLWLKGVGTAYIIADYGGGITDTTGTITVWTYEVDYIVVVDQSNGYYEVGEWVGPAVYPLSAGDVFYAAGYNSTGGFIGDVTVNWTSSDPGVGTVSPTGYYTAFNAVGPGECTVTAEYEGGITNSTGILTVATVDEIIIRDAADGGGNPVIVESYYIGKNVSMWAAGYNDTYGYLDDVSVLWSCNDTYVGTVTSPGSLTYFHALHEGTCIVSADFGGGITDSTGIITVYSPYNYTVNDDGGADFTTIQEAIDFARDGDQIFVYAGTYLEHLIINKSVSLFGENRKTTIIDGESAENVIYISAEDVTITEFTIQNGEYGIFCDESEDMTITYCEIKDYTTGIYHNKTKGGYVAYNDISNGEQGIVTFEAYNDAIRYNTISYNTVYGAKDYNSQLKNCFNWNYFHHNHIAYYYDPNVNLTTLEFDGNVIEDNYIGIMVAEASTVSLTNNTLTRNEYGIYLINASPYIGNNYISDSRFGIYAENSSSTIIDNIISEISEYGIFAESGDSLNIINNSLIDGRMFFVDSGIAKLWLEDTTLRQVNTVIIDYHLDASSAIEDAWYVQLSVVDEEANAVDDAAVLIYDNQDVLVASKFTDYNGKIESFTLVENIRRASGTTSPNPYHIVVLKERYETGMDNLTLQEDSELVITLEKEAMVVQTPEGGFPWAMAIAVGMIGTLGAIGGGVLLIEAVKFGLLSLFLPLFSRINKSNVLDQPTRYKILGYIIGNPGAHFGLIKHDLELGNGQLTDHLRHLTNTHLIYSKTDGLKKRFYPVGYPKKEEGEHPFSAIQEKIFNIIKSNSGISQKKVASKIGISRQVAGYHLTKMEKEGVIEKEVVGRETRYYPLKTFSV